MGGGQRAKTSARADSFRDVRIIHTSDWHLGRALHGVPLLDAQARFLEWLTALARERQVDAVLVAGDVYDRALPGVDAVGLLEDGLDSLTRAAPVVVVPGNHDSAQRLGFGSRWFTDRMRIQPSVAGAVTPIELPGRDGETGLLVYAVPYLDPDLARPVVAELSGVPADEFPRTHEAMLGGVAAAARADLERRRADAGRTPAVLMAHAFVVGGEPSESERDIRIGGVDSIPAEVLAGFDYVALGHLHGPQDVGPPEARVRYSGSPLAFSFSESGHVKSVSVVDFDATGRVSGVDVVPTPVQRRLSDVTGTLDEVLSDRFAAQRDDWVRVTVRDAARPDNLHATLRRVFPHLLEHRFESSMAPGRERVGVGRGRVPDPVEAASLFVRQVTGAEPAPDEQAVLRAAHEAARAAFAENDRYLEGGR